MSTQLKSSPINIRDLAILHLDDVSYNFDYVRQFLRNMKHEGEYHTCSSVDQVVLKVNEQYKEGKRFDLFILDLNMPKGDTIHLIKAIRSERFSILNDIPIILLTSESDTNKVFSALEAGANTYLPKPFSQELFFQKMKLIFSKKATRTNIANEG